MDNVTEIYSQFKQVEKRLEAIRSLYGKAKELEEITGESAVFTEEAYKLLDAAREFVRLVEESDTNLDPEKTKLEGVDKFFEGHEATEFVNNAINEVYNSQGVCDNAPCKAEDANCCQNEKQEYGENEIHDHLFEGLCWCGFKRRLKKMGLTTYTAPISAYMLSSIEATKDVEGNCFICDARRQNQSAVDELMKGNEVTSVILRATDPIEPFVRPNPGCKLVCTRNHCSCEDGW
jgi:hypothetical protein